MSLQNILDKFRKRIKELDEKEYKWLEAMDMIRGIEEVIIETYNEALKELSKSND